ncbi:MAG TPA: STAS domain-containing protein [Pyrinomonadaceae bacterium]|nr:STAS domain-containing protein [Pyrinomonadaceae bacterium]
MLQVHTKKTGTMAVLCLQGQIVTGETESLRAAVSALSGVKSVILDFAQVGTIDAGGLGVMLGLREQAGARGIRLALMNVSKGVSKVLSIARLDSVFEITSSMEFFPVAAHRRRVATAVLAPCA